MELHARRSLGLSRDEFWNLTIREYSRECTAANGRALDGYNRDIMHGWKTVAMLCQAFSKEGLRGMSTHLIKEGGGSDVISRARERMQWDAYLGTKGLKRRGLSQASKDALQRLKADEARNTEMAQEAIRSVLRH